MALINNLHLNKRGFSILESIIALTIMSVSFVAIFSTIRSAASAIHYKNIETQALILAETNLSETKLGKLTNFQTTSGKSGRFTWQVEILTTDIETLGLIKSQVVWLEKNTENKVSLKTFVQMQNFME